MDSLDAVPSAEYASLLTLSLPNDGLQQDSTFSTFDRNQNLNKVNQEHIYAQVSSNGHARAIPSGPDVAKSNAIVENKSNMMPNKTLVKNSPLIREPTNELGHSNSAPDVRKTFPNLLGLCQNNYGSLNIIKEKESVLPKSDSTIDSSVFSISGRRVIVSNGFNGTGNNNKQVNRVKEPVTTNLQNEWSSRSSLNSEESTTKLQICTDCLSLCLFVPGTVLCIISPWLLVPIYIIPSFSGSHLQTLIWISCIGSAILVFMGCMVGNMVWYRKGSGWKCRLHCGKGPKNHYWGDSLTSKRTIHTV